MRAVLVDLQTGNVLSTCSGPCVRRYIADYQYVPGKMLVVWPPSLVPAGALGIRAGGVEETTAEAGDRIASDRRVQRRALVDQVLRVVLDDDSIPPLVKRRIVVRMMRRICRRHVMRKREQWAADDEDFSDAADLARVAQLRNQLKTIVLAAASVTSKAELVVRWREMVALIGENNVQDD